MNSHRFKVAMLWTVAWIVIAGVFAFGIYVWIDWESCLIFMTAYLLEKSLSLDNVFVFLVLFNTMKTPAHLQPYVLNWGIVLALVFRAMFILAGTLLLEMFAWLMPLLGLFLVFTGLKMLWVGEEDEQELDATDDADLDGNFVNRAGDNVLVKMIAKAMPVSNKYDAEGGVGACELDCSDVTK
jgi:predicted tellurium resistance membrane protein TerC